jgi:hypothetical protein
VAAGKYCGFNNQGKSVCLDTDGYSVTGFRTESVVDCTPSSRWIIPLSTTGGANSAIASDLTFAYTFTGTTSSGNPVSYNLRGTFDTIGNVQGTIELKSYEFTKDGTHYVCQSAPYGWSATRGA